MRKESDHSSEGQFSTKDLILSMLLGFGLFAVMILAVRSGLTETFDRNLLTSLRLGDDLSDPVGPHWFEQTVRGYTELGGFPLISLAVTVSVIFLFMIDRKPDAYFLLLTIITATMIANGSKYVFGRPRPLLVPHLHETSLPLSFPSAHALVSMVTLLSFAVIAAPHIRNAAARRFVFIAAILLSVLVGFSRVYLGVHWPSDVVAGWSFGFAWFALAVLISGRWSRR